MKRRLREIIRARLAELPAVDMLIEVREDVTQTPFAELSALFAHLAGKIPAPAC